MVFFNCLAASDSKSALRVQTSLNLLEDNLCVHKSCHLCVSACSRVSSSYKLDWALVIHSPSIEFNCSKEGTNEYWLTSSGSSNAGGFSSHQYSYEFRIICKFLLLLIRQHRTTSNFAEFAIEKF